MDHKPSERWLELCKQASVEQNSEKLWELVKEIVRLMQDKKVHTLTETPRPTDSP